MKNSKKKERKKKKGIFCAAEKRTIRQLKLSAEQRPERRCAPPSR